MAATSTPPTWPALADLTAHLRVVCVPLQVPFRGVREREAALARGPRGWAEFSPFLEYQPQEAARWLRATVEAGWWGWPRAQRHSIPVNATIPAVSAAEVPEVVQRFPGCSTAKVKVAESGQELSDDVARVRAVRAAMGEDAAIRIDANGGWSLEEAASALQHLSEFRLEYAEQPCATVEDLARLRERGLREGWGVPIAADESIRRAEDPLRVKQLGAADVMVVKAPPLGGVQQALHMIDEVGLPAVVSSALDTSVGLGMGVALAAALPELNYACGLGTAQLLAGDVTEQPRRPAGGSIGVDSPEVSEELVARWAAPASRQQWWRQRIHACYDIAVDEGVSASP